MSLHEFILVSGSYFGLVVVTSFALAMLLGWNSNRSTSSQDIRQQFLERFAQGCVASNALTNSTYQATAGGELPDYFNTDNLVLRSPMLLNDMALNLSTAIKTKLAKYPQAKICFIEKDSGPIGMLLMASLLSMKLEQPVSVLRVRRQVTSMAVEGEPLKMGDTVVFVHDVITTGGQIKQAEKVLQKIGARAVAVVALCDRRENRDQPGDIDVTSLATLSEIKSRRDKFGQKKASEQRQDGLVPAR